MSEPVKPSTSGKLLDGEAWDALKGVGFSDRELLNDQPFGPVVFSYTRAQAIADGVLVDVTADAETRQLVEQAGFRLPLAMTHGAFCEAVLAGTTETPEGEFVFPAGQSLKGRLWDILTVLRTGIQAANRRETTDRVHFTVLVDENGQGRTRPVKLWCLCGPGDDGEAVLTIMREGED